MRIILASLLAIAGLVASGPAGAATATTTFTARVVIATTCVINSASILDFGSSGIIATNVDNTSTISVTCTNLAPYNVGLNAGLWGASVSARKMKGGATNTEFVNYSIYSNAGRTVNWGNTVGTDTVGGTGNGAAQSFTVYGRVPAQTTPSPGTYTDTVTVTVTY